MSSPDIPPFGDAVDGGGGLPGGRSLVALLVVVLAVLVAGGWFFRPWLHPVVYGLFASPELLVGFGFAVLVVGVGASVGGRRVLTLFPIVAFGLLVVSSATAGLYASHTLGQATIADATERADLPGVDPDHPRILTRATAERYASNSLQTSRFYATGSDITVYNNTTYWSYALAPDGTRNWLLEKQSGTVLVNMETQRKDVRVVRGDMQVGQGMALFDNYRWRLHKSGPYLVEYQDPFMVVEDGAQYIAVPYVAPEFHVRLLPFPTVYTTPTWGGVALIDSDGNVEHLSPREARNSPVLRNQRLVPFGLSRQRVAATSFRNGIVNVLPVVGAHDEQIEIAPLPGEENDQPFLIRTREGMKYVVAVEPYGQTQGVREVWVVDARTDAYEVYKTPEGSTLVGPRKAADYVRQAARETDWNRFSPAEPIPVVVDDTLYWELRVVPTDASGISYVAFVNAETTDVVGVETTEDVVAFLRGETDAVDPGPTPGDGDGDRQPTMVIRKKNADGEVIETLYVYENESVVIETNPATNETATASGS